MINRWHLDSELGKVIESVLNCDAINPPNPAFLGLPNPEKMYNVVNGRKLYKCEHKSNIQLYLYSDNVNEGIDSNCQIFVESDFIVGIIRKKDTFIPEFNTVKSAMSYLFGDSALSFTYPTLTNGVVIITGAMLGNFGINNVDIRSTAKQSDECGVFNFEFLIRFKLYFHN